MDFRLTDEQEAFRKSVLGFAEKVVAPGASDRDREGRFDPEVWRALGEFGLLGLPVPEAYGGQGADVVTTALALDALAEGGHDAGLNLSVGAHVTIGTMPIALHGTEEQKRRYLPGLCSGELVGAFAITEPEAGSDAAAIGTTAVRDGDAWVLNGSKTFITNGSIADVLTVAAVTAPEAGAGHRISCFVVEPKHLAGFEASDLDKMGTRSSPLSLLRFSDCRVPADALLGEEGTALWKIAFECFDWERTVMVASAVGGMEAEVAACVRYAKEREAFGKPIGDHQAVGHKLAEMKAWLDASRLLVYRAAWLKQEGMPHQVEASVAKYFTAEAALHVANEAIQIHGGYGYIKDVPIERAWRDAKLISIGGGTSEIQKEIIARMLLASE